MSNRREEGSFKAWLFRIARNHTFDHIRARRPAPVSFDDPNFAHEPSNVISLQHEVEKRSEMNWLLAAMGRLPERQREALVLRELGGMSYNEIGETLETSTEGVKQLIKHGRASVSSEAEANGYRSRNLGRDLALATPIASIGLIGVAGSASAAAAASGGAVAGGAGLAAAGGKVAATVLAVVAVGAGSAVVGEKVVADRSTDNVPSQSVSNKATNSPSVPAQSLVVGANASERAKANKVASNARRERARERQAIARARRTAAAKRSAVGKDHARKNGVKARANGRQKAVGRDKSSPSSGSARGKSDSAKQPAGNSGGKDSENGSGGQGEGNGSSNGSAHSNAGGKTKE
jgi:RNA polymerase sigma factor (sigma-70 family)